jgi:hypothetical protein
VTTTLYSNNFDSYIENESSGRVFIRTGGSNGFVVDAAGDVGIGTTNPIYKLQVNSGNVNQVASFESTDGNAHIELKDSLGSSFWNRGSGITSIGSVIGDSASNLNILDSGNVGIGTTTPSQKLDILADISGAGGISITNANTGSSSLSTITVNNGTIGYGGALNYIPPTYTAFPVLTNYVDLAAYSLTNGFIIRTSGSGNIKFLQGGINAANERFTINTGDVTVNTGLSNVDFRVKGTSGDVLFVDASAARVGIGTTSPSAELDVVGNIKINNTIFSDSSITLDIDYNNNQTDRTLRVTQHGGVNELFRIQEDGNVGVGTSLPAAKLDVNGGIRMADDTATASATNVGTLRYRTSGNNSYVDMCMQTGAATYAWVNIVQNNW